MFRKIAKFIKKTAPSSKPADLPSTSQTSTNQSQAPPQPPSDSPTNSPSQPPSPPPVQTSSAEFEARLASSNSSHPSPQARFISSAPMITPFSLIPRRRYLHRERLSYTSSLLSHSQIGILTLKLNQIILFSPPTSSTLHVTLTLSKCSLLFYLKKHPSLKFVYIIDSIKSCSNATYLLSPTSEGIIFKLPLYDISSSLILTVFESRTLTSPKVTGEFRLPLRFLVPNIFSSILTFEESKYTYQASENQLSSGIKLVTTLLTKQYNSLKESSSLQKYWKTFAASNSLVPTKAAFKNNVFKIRNKNYKIIKPVDNNTNYINSYIKSKANNEEVKVDGNLFKGLVDVEAKVDTFKPFIELLAYNKNDEKEEDGDFKLSTNIERAKILKYLVGITNYYKLVKSWKSPAHSLGFLMGYTYLLLICEVYELPLLVIGGLVIYGMWRVFEKLGKISKGKYGGKIPNFASKKMLTKFKNLVAANINKMAITDLTELEKQSRKSATFSEGSLSLTDSAKDASISKSGNGKNSVSLSGEHENSENKEISYQNTITNFEDQHPDLEDDEPKSKMGFFNKFSYWKGIFYYTNEVAAKFNSHIEKLVNVLNFHCSEISFVFYSIVILALLFLSLILWYVPINVLIYFSTLKYFFPDKKYWAYQVKKMKRKSRWYKLFHVNWFLKMAWNNFWERVPDDFLVTKDYISRSQIVDIEYGQ